MDSSNLERLKKGNCLTGSYVLRFWSRSGEKREIPHAFAAAAQAAT
jgi:hypothetical protein